MRLLTGFVLVIGALADECGRICERVPSACSAKGSYCKNGYACHDLFWRSDGRFCNIGQLGCSDARPVKCSEAREWAPSRASVSSHATTTRAPITAVSRTSAPTVVTPQAVTVPPSVTVARTSAPVAPRAAPAGSTAANQDFEIIAFGDFGRSSAAMIRTMDMYHSKFRDPDAVFLLGDITYGRQLSSPQDYTEYFSHVARASVAPHYAILGNHDYTYPSNVQLLLNLGRTDPRWNMPSTYYFKRFERSGFSICAWFVDTQQFVSAQRAWLRDSIRDESPTCTWKIVSGHIPGNIQASGPRFGSDFLAGTLERIMVDGGINVYLTGHHHNSQHLTNTAHGHTLHVFIAGQITAKHGMPRSPATAGNLVWGTNAEPAILQLQIDKDRISYNFHSGDRGARSAPIYSGFIAHTGA